jgi:hypothetical protein
MEYISGSPRRRLTLCSTKAGHFEWNFSVIPRQGSVWTSGSSLKMESYRYTLPKRPGTVKIECGDADDPASRKTVSPWAVFRVCACFCRDVSLCSGRDSTRCCLCHSHLSSPVTAYDWTETVDQWVGYSGGECRLQGYLCMHSVFGHHFVDATRG